MNAGIRLLAVLPLDHDAVGTGLLDGLLDVAAGTGLARVEDPERRLVGAEVGMGERTALVGGSRCRLELERGGQLLVLHVDELRGVAGLGGRAGHHDGDDLTGEGHAVAGHGRVDGRDLLGRDRPGVDAHTQLVTEVRTAEDGDDVRGRRCC